MADDDFEVDPAIAEAMGFSGFGVQPNKKRKFNLDDGFVDPELVEKSQSSRGHGNGANSLPLGTKMADRTGATAKTTSTASVATATETNTSSSLSPGAASLEALRHGVRNERGDMVYFLPSFLEDPWERLRQQN